MRKISLVLLACASFGFAQTAEDVDVARARMELERTRAFVDSGALPRVQLHKAEEVLADAQDGAVVKGGIQDLTEEQADAVLAAAGRRFDRRKTALEESQKLVTAGIAAPAILKTLQQDFDFAKRDAELADTRAKLAHQIAEMAESEAAMQARMAEHAAEQAANEPKLADRFDGDGVFTPKMYQKVGMAFAIKFGKPLPVSADGETAVHRALGFDHRGRVDVAIHPDQPEGIWLREYLIANKIPFFAFRQAVAGKATGAHIHMGPMSTHIAAAE